MRVGNFYCRNNQLTILKGCPDSVGGNFYCSDNPFIPSEMRWILLPMAGGKIIGKVIFDKGKIDNIIELVRVNIGKVPAAISALEKL